MKGGEKAISRVYSVSVQNAELFYLRLLLFNVTGCTSFEDIRTTYDDDGKLKFLLEYSILKHINYSI
jgi:hypothetical protein